MKKFLNILLRVLIVVIVLFTLIVASAAGYFYYTRWAKDRNETITYSGDKRIIQSKKIELEPTVTCLFMGVNGALTDFIMSGKYDPNTREVNLISIPRDTYVEETYDHKILLMHVSTIQKILVRSSKELLELKLITMCCSKLKY